MGDEERRLISDQVSPQERASAAERLIRSGTAEARAAVEAALDPARAGSPEQVAVLVAVSAQSNAPPWMTPRLVALLALPDLAEPARLAAVRALGSVRTRDSVRALIDVAAAAIGIDRAPLRDAAFEGLARLSGHAEFGADLNRWQLWFGQVQWISEAEWRRELAESLAARADQLAVQRQQAAGRLVEEVRRRYVTLESAGDRSLRLIELFADPQPEVRRLGLELAQQEIANARQLEPGVGDSAVVLLEDPLPAIREQAAGLVNILVPTSQSARVLEALRRETDPRVAALLLKSAVRWPARELTPVILNWLAAGPPTAAPASEALDAADKAGWLSDPATREQVLAVLRPWRERDAATLPPNGLRLLYSLGATADRQSVLDLLRDSDAAVRWAAATAVSAFPAAIDDLVTAARSDSALFMLVARAISRSRPTAAGFRTLESLPAPDASQRREQLLALSERLAYSELFQAARQIRDLGLRDAMLTRLLREPLANQREYAGSRTLKPDVVAGLFMLAEARESLDQPSGALAVLDALAASGEPVDPVGLEERRIPLLIWLGRLDEAQRVTAAPDVWLDGLERCVGEPHALDALALVEAKCGPQLSSTASERLVGLRQRILARER